MIGKFQNAGLIEFIGTTTYDTIPEDIIKVEKKFKEKRDENQEKYNSIQDGLKSKKQEEQFVSAKLLDDLIKKYTQEIKGGSDDRDLMQIWMILKLLKKL